MYRIICITVTTIALAGCGGENTFTLNENQRLTKNKQADNADCNTAQKAKTWPVTANQIEYISKSGEVLLVCIEPPASFKNFGK